MTEFLKLDIWITKTILAFSDALATVNILKCKLSDLFLDFDSCHKLFDDEILLICRKYLLTQSGN